LDGIQATLVRANRGATSGEFFCTFEGSQISLYLDVPEGIEEKCGGFANEFIANVVASLGIDAARVYAENCAVDLTFDTPKEKCQVQLSKFFGCLRGILPDYTLAKINGKEYTLLDCIRLLRCYNALHTKYMKRKTAPNKYAKSINGSKLKALILSSIGLENSWWKRIISGLIREICDPSLPINNPVSRSCSDASLKSPSKCMAILGYASSSLDVHKLEVAFSSHYVCDEKDSSCWQRCQDDRWAWESRREIRAMLILLAPGLVNKNDTRSIRKIITEGNSKEIYNRFFLSHRNNLDDLNLLYLLVKASQNGAKKAKNTNRAANCRGELISNLNKSDLIINGEKISSLRDISLELMSKICHLLHLKGEVYPLEDDMIQYGFVLEKGKWVEKTPSG
jgi:hypothetical protein